MSKHLGNILLPMPLMEDHGADALRWFMAASGSPWLQRRVGHGVLQEIVRKTLLTYWNTASFLTLYGNANDWSPLETPAPDGARPAGAGPVAALGDPPAGAGRHRRLRGLRHPAGGAPAGRARRRHVQLVRTPVAAPVLGGRPVGAGHAARVPLRRDAAARAGGAVRHRAGLAGRRAPGLAGRAGLGAPGRRGRGSTAPWSTTALAAQVALVRRVVELGRSARAESKVRNRQPLGRALVGCPRLGRAARRAAPPGGRRAQRGRLRRAGRRAGRPQRQGQLPGPRQAVRQGHPDGGRRHRGGRRRPSWPPRCGPGRRPRWSSTAPTSR